MSDAKSLPDIHSSAFSPGQPLGAGESWMLHHSARALVHQTNGSAWSQFHLVWKCTAQHRLQICQWHKKSCICLSNGQESYLYWNRILGCGQVIGFNSQALPDQQMFVLPALHLQGVSTDATRGQVVEKEGNLTPLSTPLLNCSGDETKRDVKCFKANRVLTMNHMFWPQAALKYLVP